jgi:hypothetical protein
MRNDTLWGANLNLNGPTWKQRTCREKKYLSQKRINTDYYYIGIVIFLYSVA